MDLTLYGDLDGGAIRAAPYDYVADGYSVEVMAATVGRDIGRVAITWHDCDEDDETAERKLREWFDVELAACALVTGVASTVRWTGRKVVGDDGRSRAGASFNRSLRFICEHAAPLNTYASHAEAIRAHDEIRAAARQWHIATRLLEDGEDVVLAQVYLALEVLVLEVAESDGLDAWAEFGDALTRAGARDGAGKLLSDRDLEQLYLSLQWGRHIRQGRAHRDLDAIRRPRLGRLDACWRAVEVIESYIEARVARAI